MKCIQYVHGWKTDMHTNRKNWEIKTLKKKKTNKSWPLFQIKGSSAASREVGVWKESDAAVWDSSDLQRKDKRSV